MNNTEPVAILVYPPLRSRQRNNSLSAKQRNNSFVGYGNIGVRVVEDVLNRHGVLVARCSPANANQHQVVLVGLTSIYDMYAFYRAVALRPSWQPGVRKFVVIAGGFGMQNPTAIRAYVDYAVFGRAENIIAGMIDSILGGGTYSHPAVMNLPELSPVTIEQVDGVYGHPVGEWAEMSIGCGNKCKFCHYSFARKHVDASGNDASPYGPRITGTGTMPQILWQELSCLDRKYGRVRTAIDGLSQRLRFAYGKRISNDDVVEGIEHVGSYHGTTTLLVYNIVNFPMEGRSDEDELKATLERAAPRNQVIFVLHSTPFRPSLATPMQWEGVSLRNWADRQAEVILVKQNLRAVHSFTIESAFSQLISVAALRATERDDDLFHAICFSPALRKGKSARKMKLLSANFDIDRILMEHDIDDDPPMPYLNTYVGIDTLRRIARKMRQDVRAHEMHSNGVHK